MTGLGTEIIRRSEVRLVEDTDGDGYADKATLFAGGFNSIHGTRLARRHLVCDARRRFSRPCATRRGPAWPTSGTTSLRAGAAARREPRAAPLRQRRDGGTRRLALSGPGRPRLQRAAARRGPAGPGRGRHPPLPARRPRSARLRDRPAQHLRRRPRCRVNVFVRDNENDGGDYKIRVCHSFFGADHGYPYLYHERPAEALPPLADLGLGSSAGGVCYLERHFPPEYRGNLFFCEWGKSLVRYPLRIELEAALRRRRSSNSRRGRKAILTDSSRPTWSCSATAR